jgi:hypothetical protein
MQILVLARFLFRTEGRKEYQFSNCCTNKTFYFCLKPDAKVIILWMFVSRKKCKNIRYIFTQNIAICAWKDNPRTWNGRLQRPVKKMLRRTFKFRLQHVCIRCNKSFNDWTTQLSSNFELLLNSIFVRDELCCWKFGTRQVLHMYL